MKQKWNIIYIAGENGRTLYKHGQLSALLSYLVLLLLLLLFNVSTELIYFCAPVQMWKEIIG